MPFHSGPVEEHDSGLEPVRQVTDQTESVEENLSSTHGDILQKNSRSTGSQHVKHPIDCYTSPKLVRIDTCNRLADRVRKKGKPHLALIRIRSGQQLYNDKSNII